MERGSIGTAPARASRVAVLGTLAAVLAAQAWWAATTTSGTVDEVTYLALARDVYEGVGFLRGYALPALTVPTQFRSLADSSVDGGQDLPALRAAFERVGARQPLLAYFGSAPLDAHGVSARAWVSRGQRLEPADWIAIAATYLDGLDVRGDPFAPFRRVPPSARAGYSIFLWATDRPDVREAFATAAARAAAVTTFGPQRASGAAAMASRSARV